MDAGSLTASNWTVSTRQDGEVLAAWAESGELRLGVFGKREGLAPGEMESWLRDLIAVAEDSARRDVNAREIPAILHHALSGLLFSHGELWERAGGPCLSAALIYSEGLTGVGWVGDADLQVQVEGVPQDVEWLVIRDAAGREARAATFDASQHLRLWISWNPGMDENSGIAIDAEWSPGQHVVRETWSASDEAPVLELTAEDLAPVVTEPLAAAVPQVDAADELVPADFEATQPEFEETHSEIEEMHPEIEPAREEPEPALAEFEPVHEPEELDSEDDEEARVTAELARAIEALVPPNQRQLPARAEPVMATDEMADIADALARVNAEIASAADVPPQPTAQAHEAPAAESHAEPSAPADEQRAEEVTETPPLAAHEEFVPQSQAESMLEAHAESNRESDWVDESPADSVSSSQESAPDFIRERKFTPPKSRPKSGMAQPFDLDRFGLSAFDDAQAVAPKTPSPTDRAPDEWSGDTQENTATETLEVPAGAAQDIHADTPEPIETAPSEWAEPESGAPEISDPHEGAAAIEEVHAELAHAAPEVAQATQAEEQTEPGEAQADAVDEALEEATSPAKRPGLWGKIAGLWKRRRKRPPLVEMATDDLEAPGSAGLQGGDFANPTSAAPDSQPDAAADPASSEPRGARLAPPPLPKPEISPAGAPMSAPESKESDALSEERMPTLRTSPPRPSLRGAPSSEAETESDVAPRIPMLPPNLRGSVLVREKPKADASDSAKTKSAARESEPQPPPAPELDLPRSAIPDPDLPQYIAPDSDRPQSKHSDPELPERIDPETDLPRLLAALESEEIAPGAPVAQDTERGPRIEPEWREWLEPEASAAAESEQAEPTADAASFAEAAEAPSAPPEHVVTAAELGAALGQASAAPEPTPAVRVPIRVQWPTEEEMASPFTRWARVSIGAAVIGVLFAVGWLLGGVAPRHGSGSQSSNLFVQLLESFSFAAGRYHVSVQTEPDGASIAVDGHDLAKRTPAVIDLKPGAHQVTLSYPELGSAAFGVRGLRDQNVALHEALWGRLSIEQDNPDVPVTVSIDGRDLGFVPVTVDSVEPGAHEVRFSGPNMTPWAQTVAVKVRESARIVAHPMVAPATGVLSIRATRNDSEGSAPLAGGEVWLDNELVGRTPLTLELPRGPHSVKVVYGQETAPVQVIDLPGGNQRFVSFQLGMGTPDVRLTTVSVVNRISADQPPDIAAGLEGVNLTDVREMWLHVRGPDDNWRRYSLNVTKTPTGVVGSSTFPLGVFDTNGLTKYYLSALLITGDEYFTEITTAQLVATPSAPATPGTPAAK